MVHRGPLYVVVIGCGRLGGRLASHLSARGEDVVVVDRDEEAFDALSSAFSGFRMQGDASEMDTLRRAKVHVADAVVACTTDDNLNLMIAQIAKTIWQVPTVLARVFDPQRQSIYEDMGIDTLCPAILTADYFEDIILEQDDKAVDDR